IMSWPKALRFRSIDLEGAMPQPIAGVRLRKFRIIGQDLPYWCWAAAALSVHKFYKGTLFSKQCDIATQVLLNEGTCCPPPLNAKCQKKSSTEKALKVTKNFKPPLLQRSLSFGEIK